MLVDAITSPDVTVNISALKTKNNGEYDYFESANGNHIQTDGGSFLGTIIDKRDDKGKPVHVKTFSIVDPNLLDKNGYNQGSPHELTEGYHAGLTSLKMETNAKIKSKERDMIYNIAHKNAISATYFESKYSIFGIKIKSKPSPFKSVRKNEQN